MGGWGSDRHEHATTPTVGESFEIDADDLTDAIDHPDEAHGWKRGGDEEDPTLNRTVHFEGATDEGPATHIRLEYTVADHWSDRTTEEEYPVGLEYTECNFGGVRPWFRCPGVVGGEQCGRRCRKLHFPRGGVYWLCRECYDLGYLTSRRSGKEWKQAELRYRRAFEKADTENRRPHPNNAPYFPTCPKGMHQDTFEDLTDDVQAARREWDRAMDQRMREMVGHFEDVLDEFDEPAV